MIYPLVSELAADGIPVTVTCRVLKLARQPYYRWRADPVTGDELAEAHLTNAVFDAHRDDPEFGYRFLADEVRDAGFVVSDRTVWKICSANGWWSVFGKKKARKGTKATTPAHDDLVRRDFSATAPNRLWLAGITEHRTGEGKLYLCAVKNAFFNRIVGYSIDDRMKARLAVSAIENAVVRREDVAGCVFHTDRGSQGGFNRSSATTAWSDRWATSARPATTRPWRASSRCSRRTCSTASGGPPATSSAWPSSPRSSGPITDADDRWRSAG